MTDNEPVYSKPSSQLDLERRLASDNESSRVVSTSDAYVGPTSTEGRDFRVEGNDTSSYIGTSPEYQTYANETEAPLESDEDSAEKQIFDSFAEQMKPLEKFSQTPEDREAERQEATTTAQTTAAQAAAGTPDGKAAQSSTTTKASTSKASTSTTEEK